MEPSKITAEYSEPVSQMLGWTRVPKPLRTAFPRLHTDSQAPDAPGSSLLRCFIASVLPCFVASVLPCFVASVLSDDEFQSSTKKGKRRTAPSRPVRRSLALVTFFLQVFFRQFPPIRSPKFVKLICRFNYPSPVRFEELHTNRIAFTMDWLAVGHPSSERNSPVRGQTPAAHSCPSAGTLTTRAPFALTFS